MTDLKAAVFTVLEGWALPLDARKILETAYYAQPEIKMTPEHLPQYIATNNIKPTTEGGGGAGGGTTPISPDQYERFCGKCGACTGKPWVGLTDDEVDLILWQGVFDAKDIRAIESKLKDKNT
jgi:hypothetical protein